MGLSARQYREAVYKFRTYPPIHEVADGRDSFVTVYFSLVVFLTLEYLAEVAIVVYPAGLIFPMGYLLFWAFYYIYYKPGCLEETLLVSKKPDLSVVPQLLIGVLIWFVKVTVVKWTDLIFLRWLRKRPPARSRFRPANTQRTFRYTHGSGQPPIAALPPEVVEALSVLGLGTCRDWEQIHHRYRDLAKQYHPDLNPEITEAGRRFVIIDRAYRILLLELKRCPSHFYHAPHTST